MFKLVLLSEVLSKFSFVSAELCIVIKEFAYYLCSSAPQSYSNMKVEKMHNKMIVGDFCLKETPHSKVAF